VRAPESVHTLNELDSESANEDASGKRVKMKSTKRNRAAEKKKNNAEEQGTKSKKIPAGLALMYGFTSSKVSANRLTVS
jgi:hypothetical protein